MNVGFTCDMSEWSQALQAAAHRVTNLEPVHAAIGEMLVPEVKRNIESSGGAVSWPPLAAATLTPARRAFGTKPLIKTRELIETITYDARKAYVDVGSRLKQARRLFFGYVGARASHGISGGSSTNARGIAVDRKRAARPSVSTVSTPARTPFAFMPGVLERIGELYARFILGVT